MRLKRPARLTGKPDQQAEQLRQYLFALVAELEIELDDVRKKQKKLDERIKEVEKS